jgi:biopolymer transport protein ExbD
MAFSFGSGDGEDLPEAHEINVTPFIDVMLVLLIVFMVAAPLATVSVPVHLPVASGQRQTPPANPAVLTLQADGALHLGDDPVAVEAVAAALDRFTGSDHGARVYLRGDGAVPYGRVMAVMSALRRAGYQQVALIGLDAPGQP